VPLSTVVELKQAAAASPFLDAVYVTTLVDPPGFVTQVQTRSFLQEAKENAEITATNNTTFFIFIIFRVNFLVNTAANLIQLF